MNDFHDKITDEKILSAFKWDSATSYIIDRDILNFLNSLSDDQDELFDAPSFAKYHDELSDVPNFIKHLNNLNNPSDLGDDQEELFFIEKYFFDDVIISVLNDAINEIVEYFNSNKRVTRIKDYSVLVKELFYDDETFRNIADV